MTGLRPQSDDLCDLVDLLFDEQLDAAGTDRLLRKCSPEMRTPCGSTSAS